MQNNSIPKHISWISGMPRSGTTWLSQVFSSAPSVRLKFCPLFSYEFKNALDEHSGKDEWQQLFEDVYHTESEYLDQEYLRKQGLVPRFSEREQNPPHLVIKSTRFHNLIPHILKRHPSVRFVHIVRHPCASIYSWLSNPYEFPEGADISTNWRSGDCRKTGPGEFWGFDDWCFVNQQALNLAKDYPERFLLIQYENLLKDPTAVIRQIFDFCKIEFTPQTSDFIEQSQSRHDTNKRSVYKKPGVKSQWQSKLPVEIRTEIMDQIRNTELEQFTRTD